MATNEEVMLTFRGRDEVSSTAEKIKNNVNSIGNTATGIRGKISSIASSFDSVSSAITGVLGGMSLMNQATEMWDAATQRQSSQVYLTEMFKQSGMDDFANKAKEMQGSIQDIVSQVPGDDTFMNVILSGALARETSLTTDQLSEGAKGIADYLAASEMNGKAAIETQQDLKTYILTGNTATLERDSILKEQLGTLQGQETVYGRIEALNKALKDEGFSGLSGFDTASNAMAELTGQMDKAYADLGSMFLPVTQQIIQGFLNINESVGGGLAMAIVGVSTALSGVATGIGTIGTAFTGLNSMIEFWDMLKTAIVGTQVAEEALTVATTATSVATTALNTENMAAIATQIGVTEAEVGAALAHAGNIPVIEAEGVAATTASTGFWAMAAAELAALWPILAIAAGVALWIVAIEQFGESLGWWTDFSTMLDAIKAGVERLWNAFINSPQVQGTLATIQNAFQSLMTALQPVFDWLTAAWNNLFKSEGAGSGGPDVVGQIISLFGQLGSIAGDVVNTLVRFGSEVYAAMAPVREVIMSIINTFSQLVNGNISFEQFIVQIFTLVTTLNVRINQLVLQIGQRILNGIVNALRPIPQRLWQFLQQAAIRLLLFGVVAAVRARNAGQRILNGIVNYIRQLPGRVGAYMMQVPGRIASAAGAAVGAAASLASQVVQAVTNGIMGVADTVYNEFMSIPGRINSAVSDAVSAAANFGSSIKDAVLNALNIHSPGIIQRKIAIEFQDIPGRIGESNDSVYSAARNYAGNILNGFNAPQMNIAGVSSLRQNANYVPVNNSTRNVTIVHVHENAVPVDARNMTKREAQGVVTLALESLVGPTPEGV